MTDEVKILEGQIRECYGRVVYTHKTHEKCADLLFRRHQCIKVWQIVLSALVTGGVLSTLWPDTSFVFALVTSILSTILLALNSYTKDYDLGEVAQKHRQAASEIWVIRERYLNLLTDIRSQSLNLEAARAVRDELLDKLGSIYSGAPSTNAKAYQLAQAGLKSMEEMTFSDEEIDKFVPRELRRNKG